MRDNLKVVGDKENAMIFETMIGYYLEGRENDLGKSLNSYE